MTHRTTPRLAGVLVVALVTVMFLGSGGATAPAAAPAREPALHATVAGTIGPVSTAPASPNVGTPVWTNVTSGPAPPPRRSAGMVWDSSDNYTLLFGGENTNGIPYTYYNDTWSFANHTWVNRTTPASPSARFGFFLADDPSDHEVVLFGGSGPAPTGSYNDQTWVYRAGVWTNVTAAGGPTGRFWGSMSYDTETGTVLLFAGNQGGGTNTTYSNDTWQFHAGTWTKLTPTAAPGGRYDQAQVDDLADHDVVMFGGLGPTQYLNDTWTFASGTWVNVTPPNSPDARAGAGMVYDPDVSAVVMYGGYPANSYYADTWVFQGGTWTAYDVSPAPPAGTIWGQMAYDASDHCVVMLQGDGAYNATWELTFPASSPLGVTAHAAPNPVGVAASVAFSASPTGGSPPYAFAWAWGDSTSNGTGQNVSHTYGSAGNYTATVTVTDSALATATDSVVVQVFSSGTPLSVTVTAAPTLAQRDENVSFTSNVTGGTGPFTYNWSFADGNGSTAADPVHAFATVGVFNVTLAVEDANGTTADGYVVVTVQSSGPPPLGVTISAVPTSATVGETVNFSSRPSGGVPPYTFLWRFGDLSSATTQNASHAYAAAGAYNVSLNVSDANGSFVVRYVTVDVGAAPLTVTVRASASTAQVNQTVDFSSQPSGGTPPYAFHWSFGDGTSASTQNASDAYARGGTFTATLFVNDSDGHSVNRSVSITVQAGTGPNSSSGTSPYVWLGLGAGVAVVALLIAYVVARRRSAPPGPPEGGPPAPPSA